jgi:hypothetical protein
VAVVRNTVARLELQSGKKLQAVITDQGSKYVNGEMAAYFGEKGVFHQTTARCSLEQNGVAERLNWVLMERARAMLIESELPDEMWAEAVVTANNIRNRTPVSAHGKTPWEAFYGKKPDVSHMRVFGARAFMHVPGALRHKLEPVSEKGRFVGYEANAKAYRILREQDNRVIVSRDVIVDERAKGSKPRSEFEVSPVEAPGEKPGLNGEPIRAAQNPREENPNGKKDEKKDGEVEKDIGGTEEIGETGESGDGLEKRYPTRERRAPGEWYRANMAADGKETEPQTYEEVLAGPDAELWRRAMDEEFAPLLENGTWELEKLPEGFKALPMKWVYKIKRDANGNNEHYKARLVAKG